MVKGAKGTIWLIVGYLLATVVNPVLTETAKSLWNRYGFLSDAPAVHHCLPIADAFQVLKNEAGEILASGPMSVLNRTTLFLENDTSKPLQDFSLTVNAVNAASREVEALRVKVLTDSAGNSDRYTTETSGKVFRISTPAMNVGETIALFADFDGPVGMIVELSSRSGGWRYDLVPSCEAGSVKTGPLFEVFRSETTHCKWDGDDETECTVRSSPLPFNISGENRGKVVSHEMYFRDVTKKPRWWDFF